MGAEAELGPAPAVPYLLFSLFGLYMTHVEAFYMKFYMTHVENNIGFTELRENPIELNENCQDISSNGIILPAQAKILMFAIRNDDFPW